MLVDVAVKHDTSYCCSPKDYNESPQYSQYSDKLHRDTFLPLRLVELTVYLIHSSSLLRASLGSDDLGFSVVSVVFAQHFYASSNLAATFLTEVFPSKKALTILCLNSIE